MSTYADDGYGNLVPVANPYGKTTTVYQRINGKLAGFVCGTGDHALAISALRASNGDIRLSKFGRWSGGPVLAVIDGGAA